MQESKAKAVAWSESLLAPCCGVEAQPEWLRAEVRFGLGPSSRFAARLDKRETSGGAPGQGESLATKKRRRMHLVAAESTTKGDSICGLRRAI
jgi:hypothetical protein